ncbi:hypothetical protein C7B65_22135 [Phormidesmis priestleyi ULC007]|uniref:Primosomal protein n=1 Tax=Phormidesmis priestleyi ULC007 TaxID=1920490 RepID=A0A2T1D732_9CYAN|nr:hypothetical protein [Phormidesmis priestleyi]PSB16325.1 hypothetical protein C7B65_22135 [Phormidesmis priestleyi ULC007]PZO46976.1 MAG: hypothetical protein DCF14_21025 [Phormidesmis priestleyi]
MVGSVEQISQQLVALDKQVAEMGEKFYQTYFSYLTALGQAVRQQLILSCYHVCTESYPRQFLQLSLSQRQQFQQSVRDLANQIQAELLAQLQPVSLVSTETANIDELEEDLDVDDDGELDEAFDEQEFESDSVLESHQNELEFLLLAPSLSKPAQPSTPLDALVQWQENLEKSIVKKLQTTSHAANLLLQQSEVLPKRLPEPVLKAAAKAGSDDPIAGNANLLKLLVEAADEKMSEQGRSKKSIASLLHLVAIQLRLSEIEFNDSTAMAWRNKLRDLKQQLQTLGREYQKKHQERAIAQAQDAWRSTWTND